MGRRGGRGGAAPFFKRTQERTLELMEVTPGMGCGDIDDGRCGCCRVLVAVTFCTCDVRRAALFAWVFR